MKSRPKFVLPAIAAAFALVALFATPGRALDLIETETLARTHDPATLPPVAERVPEEPLIVDMAASGRTPGRHGGDLQTLIGRAKDARLINVWGYARLVGFNENLDLVPDILKAVDVEEGRIFTLHLRKGHKWSDGQPFTSEDFRYYFEDVASNPELNPSGLPSFLKVNEAEPVFEVIDETTVRYTWPEPNPDFLTNLAAARPPFIYRPSHYLGKYNMKTGDPKFIEEEVERTGSRNWAALHNKLDDMYDGGNPDLPSLQPWVLTRDIAGQRFEATRNAFYHRVDSNGRQLPYIDKVVLSVADGRLIAAKTRAGESDLQARGLAFSDITVLKQGEEDSGYKTALWPIAKASHIALYPNFNVSDPEFRKLLWDPRFRLALSHGIDRRIINESLFFGLATPSNNTVLPQSPLYREHFREAGIAFDPDTANKLLDEIGLTERRGDGIRLMPDGRPLEIVVEKSGESNEQIDVLELIKETWREIGVGLFPKASQRDNLRRRAYSGEAQMTVWEGFDNGIPTAVMSPAFLAPTSFVQLSWGAWGDFYESSGKDGKAPDYEPAIKLLDLYKDWLKATDDTERARIWTDMLTIHADQMLTIGIVSEVRQPVVIKTTLRNVPEEAIFGWDPGAQFGMHRMDEFWLDRPVEGRLPMGQNGQG